MFQVSSFHLPLGFLRCILSTKFSRSFYISDHPLFGLVADEVGSKFTDVVNLRQFGLLGSSVVMIVLEAFIARRLVLVRHLISTDSKDHRRV